MTSNMTRKRIVMAMSGGVDSSVAAYLLHHQIDTSMHSVMGLHMNNWNAADEEPSRSGGSGSGGTTRNAFCVQSEQDANDAERICDMFGMKLHRVSFASEYWNGVFEPFLDGISEGRTMNPDIGCNSIVKFGAMRDYAQQNLKADYIATGHYARLWHRPNTRGINHDHQEDEFLSSPMVCVQESLADTPEEEWIYNWGRSSTDSHGMNPLLLSGADGRKDQSYFLCGVKGDAFSNVLFPLGDLIKDKSTSTSTSIHTDHEVDPTRTDLPVGNNDDVNLNTMSVREIASLSGLPTASKKDSMGICFIGKRKFPAFISEYLPPNESLTRNFIDIDTGEIVGTYNDSSHFTIGQGAKISGASQKWFVTKKDDTGTVFVCSDTHHPSLYSDELLVREEDFNWIGGELPQPLFNKGNFLLAMCRTRHLQALVPCQVSRFESFIRVKFDRPVRALTPGQTAAIYVGRGLICLGGGQIWKHGDTYQDLGLDLPSDLHPSGSNDLSINNRRNQSTST